MQSNSLESTEVNRRNFFYSYSAIDQLCIYDAAEECSIWTIDPHASVEFHSANCCWWD